MANILSSIISNVTPGRKRIPDTRPSVLIVKIDGVPDEGEGVDLPIGSIAVWDDNGVGTTYFKTGAAATDWVLQILSTTLRTIDLPIVGPGRADGPPGTVPDVEAVNALTYINFDGAAGAQAAFRMIKIPATYIGNASIHVHWTKSVNTDRSGETVSWRVSYAVINGSSEDAADGTIVIDLDDTYEDSGTTTRIVHRTADASLIGIIPNCYVNIKIEKNTPGAGTPMDSPGLVALDLIYQESILPA